MLTFFGAYEESTESFQRCFFEMILEVDLLVSECTTVLINEFRLAVNPKLLNFLVRLI